MKSKERQAVNVKVHIERVILDGFSLGPGQGAQVKAALEAELARLIAEGGISPLLNSGGAFPSLSANPLQVSGDAKLSPLGEQIARSVYGAMGHRK